MVVGAKALGLLLSRKDAYYKEDGKDA